MAKTPQVTCRHCKKKIDKDTAYSVRSGWYFCDEDCYNAYNNARDKAQDVTCYVCHKHDKKQNMTYYLRHYFCPDCLQEWLGSEDGQRDTFLDYVWNLYSPDVRKHTSRYMTIRKQAEYYHKEYGFKYKGMLLAVKYHVNTLEKLWRDEYGLGQVFPNAYLELKELWEQQERLRTTVSKADINKKEKIVVGRRSPVRKGMLSLD